MTLIHVSGPTALPVALEDLRLHTRIDTVAEDSLLEAYMQSALEDIERRTGVVFLAQVWRWVGDAFPAGDSICLEIGPLVSVSALTYLDADGAEQTLDAAEYRLDTVSPIGRVYRVGSAWPATSIDASAVSVTFTAGRGVVPPSVRHAIMLRVADAVMDPEGGGDLKMASTSLISSHRRIVF